MEIKIPTKKKGVKKPWFGSQETELIEDDLPLVCKMVASPPTDEVSALSHRITKCLCWPSLICNRS